MGEVVQFRDFQNPKDLQRAREQQLQEQMAYEAMGIPWNAHDKAIYESSLGYIAPDTDPA